ncbi:MAG: hypothetical protein WB626_10635 [Bacteroidota bacterium]
MMTTTIVTIAVGILLLLYGRKLFWLCVAGLGFLAGITFGPPLLGGPQEPWVLVGALLLGAGAALAAVFLQKAALIAAGFVAGALVAYRMAGLEGWDAGAMMWLVVAAAGVLGAVALSRVFEWALVVLSSLAGALLIGSVLPVEGRPGDLVFLLLALGGILFQFRSRGPRKAKGEARKE